jgi:hypothetical protein
MVVGVIALILAVIAALLGRAFVDDEPAPSQTRTKDGLVNFKDERQGLAISYPAIWQRIASPDPRVSLVAGTAEVSLLMRTRGIGTAVGVKDLERARILTNRLVAKAEKVKQLRPPRHIENLGGLPGWLYIYSFFDPATKLRGAHAHYFLFRGKEMVTLVFQTIPSESFATYAPLFDRLAGTFMATEPAEASDSDS